MEINNDTNDYSDFIGAKVRDINNFFRGVIVSLDRVIEDCGHQITYAITSKGDRINCRKFGVTYKVRK